MMVTGVGSTYYQTSGDFSLGGGGNNSLVIANGGTVVSPNFVTGGNSSGLGNQVIITNGGFAQTIGLNVGQGTGQGGNLLLVSGPTSVYTNTSTAIIGVNSSNNNVVVENGAKFYTKGAQTYVAATLVASVPSTTFRSRATIRCGIRQARTQTLFTSVTMATVTCSLSPMAPRQCRLLLQLDQQQLITVAGSNSLLNIGYYFGPRQWWIR